MDARLERLKIVSHGNDKNGKRVAVPRGQRENKLANKFEMPCN